MVNKYQPAFPVVDADNVDNILITRSEGLSKREYFAGLAMQGLLSVGYNPDKHPTPVSKTIAHKSVELADALLKALEQ